MALRETAMTAPLGQQGEPLAANGRPYKKNWCGPLRGFPPVTIPRYFRELSKDALVREHPRLPCVKGGAPRSESKLP